MKPVAIMVLRIACIAILSCSVSNLFAQPSVSERGRANRFLLNASEQFKASIRSAQARFTVRETAKSVSDMEPKIVTQATVDLYYHLPRYHLIVNYDVALNRNQIKRQHIYFDGFELIEFELDQLGQISAVVDRASSPKFTRVDFPLDDPLFLDVSVSAKLRKELDKLEIKPLKSGGFWAYRSQQVGDSNYIAKADFFVGKYGPFRGLEEIRSNENGARRSSREEVNLRWDKKDGTPYVSRLMRASYETMDVNGAFESSSSKLEVDYQLLEINPTIEVSKLEMDAADIPIGTRFKLKGLFVRGEQVHRIFVGGNEFVDEM